MNLYKGKFRKKLIAASVIIAICIFSSLTPVFRKFFPTVIKEPLIILTLIKREMGAIIFFHRNFIQNERLIKENASLRYKLNAQEELYLENARLKALLAIRNDSSYRLVPARVIGRSPDNWSSVIIIDQGKERGIKRGMVAITHLGLAGRVIETTNSNSKIMLINDPNVGVSSIIQRSREEGLVSGALGNNLIMKYLGEKPDIGLGDEVITSGLSQVYPKGILIGSVIEVRRDFSGTSFYAVIKPAVNLSKIEEVLVIIR